MNIQENVDLKNYSTMGLGGRARYLATVKSREDVTYLNNWASQKTLETIMIGGGSNSIWRDSGFEGLIMVNQIRGISLSYLTDYAVLDIGSGEEWDKVVEYSTNLGLSGIECLSLIPGKSGSTVIQNVGAYGQEIKDTLISVEVIEKQTNKALTINVENCGLSYRKSRFNSEDRHKYYILSIKLKLAKTSLKPPFYSSLEKYLNEHDITDYSPDNIRQAVIAIRNSKLPDPSIVKNCGSFFGNPVIDNQRLKELLKIYPDLPNWPQSKNQSKLSAAWLIESIGMNDYLDAETGIATWRSQPLVLVNHHARSTEDLLKFKRKITTSVHDKFGIDLHQEPEMLP